MRVYVSAKRIPPSNDVSMDHGHEIVPISEASRIAVEDVLMDAVGGDIDRRRARARALMARGEGFALLSLDEVVTAVLGHEEDATWVIDAIGTGRTHRGNGGGRKLIEMLSVAHPDKTPVAETDDGALGFYRATGFNIELLPPRWPGVNRYHCTRHALPRDTHVADLPQLLLPSAFAAVGP